MRSKIFLIGSALAFAAATPSSAAETNHEAVLFSRALFKGVQMRISEPTRSIGAFLVKSVQIPPDSLWELCTGNTFTGCKRFTQSKSAMVMTVRSARPVAAPIPASASLPGASIRGSNASLRGLASEFFVTPEDKNGRIEVDSSAGALPRRATAFCRDHGWRLSAYQRDQAIEGRRYLADVLCTDEAQ